jgi:hypothetical protein
MSHYEEIKENYQKRRNHENDCIAAAKSFVRKLGSGLGWPDDHKHIAKLAQVSDDEHVVDGAFAFNKHGRLRFVVQFSLDADSKPASIECSLEKASAGAWFIIAAGVQHTFDLYGQRLIPDDLSHAALSAIKVHFAPTYQIMV